MGLEHEANPCSSARTSFPWTPRFLFLTLGLPLAAAACPECGCTFKHLAEVAMCLWWLQLGRRLWINWINTQTTPWQVAPQSTMITESYLSLVLDPRSEPHFPVLSPVEQLGCLWLQCRLPVCVHRSKSPSWPQGDISPSAHCEPFQVTAQDPLSDPEMKNSTLVTQSKGPAHRCGSASTKPPNEKNILFYPSLP